VIVQVYGGPSGPRVLRNWYTPEDQILLDAGYILFSPTIAASTTGRWRSRL
jgi:dipeptidyl aminopeptidase/acylaminoacyl peptidase